MSGLPSSAQAAVLQPSQFSATADSIEIRGEDFSGEVTLDSMMEKMIATGFQATNIGLAIAEINRMLAWRLCDRPILPDEQEEYRDLEYRRTTGCKIFLACTSNMISCGVRETIRFLVQHKMVRADIS